MDDICKVIDLNLDKIDRKNVLFYQILHDLKYWKKFYETQLKDKLNKNARNIILEKIGETSSKQTQAKINGRPKNLKRSCGWLFVDKVQTSQDYFGSSVTGDSSRARNKVSYFFPETKTFFVFWFIFKEIGGSTSSKTRKVKIAQRRRIKSCKRTPKISKFT